MTLGESDCVRERTLRRFKSPFDVDRVLEVNKPINPIISLNSIFCASLSLSAVEIRARPTLGEELLEFRGPHLPVPVIIMTSFQFPQPHNTLYITKFVWLIAELLDPG